MEEKGEAHGLGPQVIRALRGEQSRAAFARLLGVTPLTVYRWELPDEAPQARRPRGRVAQALRQLLEGGASTASRPTPSNSKRQELHPDESARLAPCLARLRKAEWRAAEEELMALLASGALRTPGARALAAVGLSYLLRWGREDCRGAFTTLLPHLEEANQGLLPEAVELQVHALAANLYASPDGKLFDADKSDAHVARAEALLAILPGLETAPTFHGAAEVRCHLRIAELACGFYLGEAERVARCSGRMAEALAGVTDPVLRLLAEDCLAHEATIRGEAAQATRRFREVAQGAARLGYPFLEARNLAFLAQRRLEECCEPQEALGLVRRAREAAYGGRMVRGFSFIFAARSEAEALIRLTRFAEAEAVLDEADAVVAELSWTPLHLVVMRSVLCLVTGRHAEQRKLAARLAAYDGPIQRNLTLAYGLFAEAMADLTEGLRPRAAERFAATASRVMELGGWPFLRRECLVYETGARAFAGQLAEARVVLRRARVFLERMPSAIHSAVLSRFEGVLLALEGRPREAREQLESSLGTLRLAGDLTMAGFTRHLLAQMARLEGDPAAEELLSASEAELRRAGLALPQDFTRVPGRPLQTAPTLASGPPRLGAEALVVPFERLSVRGMGASLIQRELLGVLEGLFPGCLPRLEELDSLGHATLVAGSDTVPASEAVEFGDGCGRRLRLGVAGPLPADGRALLTALSRLGGFALEVAALRGFAEAESLEAPVAGAESERDMELPGFIAASPAMKRLRAELARLSSSRATVIVTGESGAGKELVARALHTLSTRAQRPYVAFNCAAVPKELFEGQLFGYRRGAYTGAATDHPGVIRAAHGGTLFLDEIGELPLDVQPKLLRFLENGEVFPLGEMRPVEVDVRVVAATHRDLSQLVREGRFREDLYYRLNVVPVRVPPLRERREDVVALARHFVRQLTPEGQDPPQLAPDALAALVAHPWPGNVRELRNVIERSMAYGPLPAVLGAEQMRIAG
ncbi:sigma 54-interacting transcriptional regulator [Pyxidicoccus fallax]|uniref:Sigma 54-interacting transcriptional regulator n=1 Tax=Pyxidicoccus fallax TaxID=394095 RepID=A0A848LRU1_9BACT|nr:sigma-54 dependent transcriptional regulator [Pyxidicoccus fallax]NMO20350.1 sigma 54-interacting transcriptional regulator [Pyxidicoccus fallax]NPC85873.1 sigma 54-interacting transcriptional regulator [Pyxidicoccus fallax]